MLFISICFPENDTVLFLVNNKYCVVYAWHIFPIHSFVEVLKSLCIWAWYIWVAFSYTVLLLAFWMTPPRFFSDSPDFSKSSLSHWSSAHTLLTIKITVLSGAILTSSSVHSVPTVAGCFFRPALWLSFWECRASSPCLFVFCFFSPCICCLLNSTSCSFSGCLSDLLREIHKPYQW